jgi:hypothetical protein
MGMDWIDRGICFVHFLKRRSTPPTTAAGIFVSDDDDRYHHQYPKSNLA